MAGVKHLVLGLVIGVTGTSIVALAIYFSAARATTTLLLSPTPAVLAAASTQTATGTVTPTMAVTPTFTPIATLSSSQVAMLAQSSATGTPDPVRRAIGTGELAFAGPLSRPEQVALYLASLRHVRASAEQSRLLAKEINGVGYGDPSNICGPLALAILRDAGLVSPDLQPHAFWLLNPVAATDARLLERVFPWELYAHVVLATPLNEMDWRTSPLLPGDFVFIWHGSGGNFDHMLVVSRVDRQGRAYAVTNYGTDSGYVIAEAPLYDPADREVGLFHQWTRERDAILGSTGFGGFELWRRRSP